MTMAARSIRRMAENALPFLRHQLESALAEISRKEMSDSAYYSSGRQRADADTARALRALISQAEQLAEKKDQKPG